MQYKLVVNCEENALSKLYMLCYMLTITIGFSCSGESELFMSPFATSEYSLLLARQPVYATARLQKLSFVEKNNCLFVINK